jgi:hypothetical protein
VTISHVCVRLPLLIILLLLDFVMSWAVFLSQQKLKFLDINYVELNSEVSCRAVATAESNTWSSQSAILKMEGRHWSNQSGKDLVRKGFAFAEIHLTHQSGSSPSLMHCEAIRILSDLNLCTSAIPRVCKDSLLLCVRTKV